MIDGVTYRPVPTHLERWVATIHRGDFPPGEWVRIPALLGQVWRCDAPVWWIPPGKSEPARLPQFAIVGPTSAAFWLMVEQPGAILGCGLWPLGWCEIVRHSAAALADVAIDAGEVWPIPVAALKAETTGSEEAGWRALERFVAQLAAQALPSLDHDRIAVIDSWLATTRDVQALCALLDRSPRQVARITRRTHGGPPRLIASKWRTLQAASELGLVAPEGAWWSDRFADQSHFIREFHRFIGQTPKIFVKGTDRVAHRVVADPWHVESDHPLALFRTEPISSDDANRGR